MNELAVKRDTENGSLKSFETSLFEVYLFWRF